MTTPGDPVYEYGIDAPIREARTVTIDSERQADEVYAQAQRLGPLPSGYVVRALIRCNQLDTFRMVACDWSATIETKSPVVQDQARRKLSEHLRHAHPYLDRAGRAVLIRAIHFNFRDIGR